MTIDPWTELSASELIAVFEYLYGDYDEGVWLSPADVSELSYANPAFERLVGERASDTIADPFAYLQAVHPDDRPERRSLRQTLRESHPADGQPGDVRSVFRLSDGTETVRWLSERVFPLPDSDGEIRYWCGFIRDITDHHEEVATLSTQVEQLRLVSQTFRHDIRNSANLGMDLLRNARRDGDEEETLAVIESTLERMVEQTESMRDMTKLTLALSEESETVSLPRAIEGELASVSLLTDSVTLKTCGTVPDIRIRASESLPLAFRCLIENAVRHNDGESPVVALSSSLSNDRVAVHIADNGPGIPDNRKEAVFERGVALSENGGSGFGLSFAETLVTQYGGKIYLTDNEPHGSIFTVVLPRVNPESGE